MILNQGGVYSCEAGGAEVGKKVKTLTVPSFITFFIPPGSILTLPLLFVQRGTIKGQGNFRGGSIILFFLHPLAAQRPAKLGKWEGSCSLMQFKGQIRD